ncbi:TPA: hypothetical protein ME760_005556, partial [Klebsiella pneumoniae]|nr:hypothetical protein [Klebsiella pneumoniae]
DKKVNPFRYDVTKFAEKIGNNIDAIDAEIYKEISIVKVQSTNLSNVKEYYKTYPSCLMAAEIDLYTGILNITNERLKIIIEHCDNNNLTPELLTTALSMINYIDNL